MIDSLFLKHPRSVGETYLQHARVALGFGGMLFTAALACAVHAVVPGIFQRTASGIIVKLHARMIAGRRPSIIDPVAFDYAI